MYHPVLLQTHLRHGRLVVLLKSRKPRSKVGIAIKRMGKYIIQGEMGYKGEQPAHIRGCGCEDYSTRSYCSHRYAPHNIYYIASVVGGSRGRKLASPLSGWENTSYRAKWGKGEQPAHICGCGCEEYSTRSYCSHRYAPHNIHCIASVVGGR